MNCNEIHTPGTTSTPLLFCNNLLKSNMTGVKEISEPLELLNGIFSDICAPDMSSSNPYSSSIAAISCRISFPAFPGAKLAGERVE